MIHFPRKICLSISTTHAIWTQDRGAKKFKSLKDFEVHSVLEKEQRPNRQDTSIQMTRLARSKKWYGQDCPIMLSI
jgi:hypothetical protein